MSKRKKDLLLITLILVIAVVGLLINFYIQKEPSTYLTISIDQTIVETLDLSKDTELLLETDQGGSNRLIVKDGMAWISEASCPDHVCIHQGKIQLSGQMIVCLPNRVVIQVVSESGAY